jgi:hypothetical protein
MRLFPEHVRVKENRKILLCKRSGGDAEICAIRNKNAAPGCLRGLIRKRSLGFVELVDLCRQDEIALRQTADLVRPGCDLDFSPGKENVWVVPLLLRKLAYAVYEFQRFAKVGKREGLRDVVPLNHIPSVDLLFKRGEFFTL